MELLNIAEVVDNKLTPHFIASQFGGCTVLDNKLFVCSDDNTLGKTKDTATYKQCNEMLVTLSNSLFIVSKDRNGTPLEFQTISTAIKNLFENAGIKQMKQSIGYFVNENKQLMQEDGLLITGDKQISQELIQKLKVILNQESMGYFNGKGLQFL